MGRGHGAGAAPGMRKGPVLTSFTGGAGGSTVCQMCQLGGIQLRTKASGRPRSRLCFTTRAFITELERKCLMEHSRSPMFKCNQTVLLNLDVSKEKKKSFHIFNCRNNFITRIFLLAFIFNLVKYVS